MVQLMPLPLTVPYFSKIQTGFTFLVLPHPGSPGQRAVKRVCFCCCKNNLYDYFEKTWIDMGQNLLSFAVVVQYVC